MFTSLDMLGGGKDKCSPWPLKVYHVVREPRITKTELIKNKDDPQNNWPLWLQKFPEGAGQEGTEQVSRELFTGREFTWDLAGWLEFGEAGKQMHKILRFPNYDPLEDTYL